MNIAKKSPTNNTNVAAMMREEGKKIQENRLNKTTQSPQTRKPFEPSGFGR